MDWVRSVVWIKGPARHVPLVSADDTPPRCGVGLLLERLMDQLACLVEHKALHCHLEPRFDIMLTFSAGRGVQHSELS